MKDALVPLRSEECAGGMEQRNQFAIMRDAPAMSKMEEFVMGTGQRSQLAAQTDATTMRERAVSALGMERRRRSKNAKSAAMKDAPIKPKEEECAGGMGLRDHLKNAVKKGVPILP